MANLLAFLILVCLALFVLVVIGGMVGEWLVNGGPPTEVEQELARQNRELVEAQRRITQRTLAHIRARRGEGPWR